MDLQCGWCALAFLRRVIRMKFNFSVNSWGATWSGQLWALWPTYLVNINTSTLYLLISSLAQTRWQKEHYFKWIVYVEQTQFQIMQVDTSISWNSCGGEAYSKFTLARIDVSRTSIRILVFLELTRWGWSIWEKYLTTNRKCNMKSEYN